MFHAWGPTGIVSAFDACGVAPIAPMVPLMHMILCAIVLGGLTTVFPVLKNNLGGWMLLATSIIRKSVQRWTAMQSPTRTVKKMLLGRR